MPTINGAAASTTLLNYAPLEHEGACLYYVWLAYHAHGATSLVTYASAYSAWLATKKRHTDRNPPAGAAVWFGRRYSDGNMSGDVCISVGGGQVACTDYPFWKMTGVASISQREAQTDRFYLGWTEDFLGNTVVTLGATAGGGTVTPFNPWDDKAKQTFLQSIGLYTDTIDGVFGPASKAATETFQGYVGLKVDGVFGPLTIGKAEIVKAGGLHTTAHTVTQVQTFLKSKGLYSGSLDGIWGVRTSLGTARFQLSQKLTVDALWGQVTDAKAFPPVAPTPAPTGTPIIGHNATSRPTTDIQTFLAGLKLYTGAIDGDYGAGTTAAVMLYQASKFIAEDGIWGLASDGLAFPMGAFGCDYSDARPDPATLKARGVKFVYRYLWPASYNTKGVTPDEDAALKAQGIQVVYGYEETGTELKGGNAAGVRVATAAEALLGTLGVADMPVYFNADYDAPLTDYPAIIDALRGAGTVIGVARVGLYAKRDLLKAAFDAGVISWGFQPYAWSQGLWEPRAQIRQFANDQWDKQVDFDSAMVAEFGQHPVVTIPTPTPDPSTPDPALSVTVDRAALTAVRDQINVWLA